MALVADVGTIKTTQTVERRVMTRKIERSQFKRRFGSKDMGYQWRLRARERKFNWINEQRIAKGKKPFLYDKMRRYVR